MWVVECYDYKERSAYTCWAETKEEAEKIARNWRAPWRSVRILAPVAVAA